MNHRHWLGPITAAAIMAIGNQAHAVSFNDAIGDYVPGYTGSKLGDLDVVSAQVTYNRSNDTFVFAATMNADIGSTPGGFYVWGLNRGAGTAGFAANGFGGVLFDTVLIFNADTSLRVNSANVTLPVGTVKVIGSTVVASVSGSLLASTGFAKTAYTWNLWPRDAQQPAGFAQISDFAPDNSNLAVTVIGAVPEPTTALLWAAGLGGLVLGARRHRASVAA